MLRLGLTCPGTGVPNLRLQGIIIIPFFWKDSLQLFFTGSLNHENILGEVIHNFGDTMKCPGKLKNTDAWVSPHRQGYGVQA